MKRQTGLIFLDSNSPQGFTLIEIMLALMVFTVGILAVTTMTLTSMGGFTRARLENLEINKSALNMESLKHTGYKDQENFKTGTKSVPGMDGDHISFQSADNSVVEGTKLITMRNADIKSGDSADGVFTIYFTKPFITRPR